MTYKIKNNKKTLNLARQYSEKNITNVFWFSFFLEAMNSTSARNQEDFQLVT